jgi:hypothetical protein
MKINPHLLADIVWYEERKIGEVDFVNDNPNWPEV